MAKKKKSPNPNTNENQQTSAALPFYDDFYVDMYTLKQMPIAITFLEKLAEELTAWVRKNNRAYKITQFLEEKGIDRTTFQRWMTRCPKLAIANSYAVMVLGNRREAGMIEKRFAEHSTMFAMPMYDEDWMNMHKFHAELRKKEEEKRQNITIVIPDIRDKGENEPVADQLPDKTGSDPKIKQVQGA